MRTSKVHLSLSVAAALTLLSPVSAAERIVLSCSGTMFVPGQFGVAPVPDQSFIIDLDKGSVSSSLGDFSITKVTEDRVDFRARLRPSRCFHRRGCQSPYGCSDRDFLA